MNISSDLFNTKATTLNLQCGTLIWAQSYEEKEAGLNDGR